MRLDDLRAELHAQADRAGTTREVPAVHRLEEVQTRVHRIRRRRATATAVGAVAAVALVALAVVPPLQSQRSAPAPASGPTKTAHTDRPNPWEWQKTSAGDTLVLGEVGERGQSRLAGTFTPHDTDMEWRLFCDTGDRPGVSATHLSMAYSVNGNNFGAVACDESSDAVGAMGVSFGDASDANRAAWAPNGVRAGEHTTVRAWVENRHGNRVSAPDVRMGFALYQRTAPRIERHGVVIPTLIDVSGQTYRLDDHTIEPFTASDRSARLDVPAADGPRYVQSGVVQRGQDMKMRVDQYVDGRVTGGTIGGGMVGAPLKNRGAHVLGVRVHRGEPRGSLVIAVYERVTDQQPK